MSEQETIQILIEPRHLKDSNGNTIGGAVRATAVEDQSKWDVFAIPLIEGFLERVEKRNHEGHPVTVLANFFEMSAEEKSSQLFSELLD